MKWEVDKNDKTLHTAVIGDVASWKVNYSDATGHTTIYTGNVHIKGYPMDGNSSYGTIGAGSDAINYKTEEYLNTKTNHYHTDNIKIKHIEE